MTEQAPAQLAPEVEALVLAELGKRVKARTELVKATFSQRYPDGHRESFRAPDGSKLGMVYRSDPDPRWVVADEQALHAELRKYPGNLETVVEIVDHDAAVEVLRVHAPELLAEVTRVRPEVVAEELKAAAAGALPAPGIAQVKPSGVLTVKPDPKAGEAVERMVAAGVITWDGRPALPAGDKPDPAVPAGMIAAVTAYAHQQGGRPDGSWGCRCGWEQDKPHAEHVADMAAAAFGDDVAPRVLAAEARREMRDMIDRSSLGEHVRETGPDGFARCRCGRWSTGSFEDHVADEAARDMERSR